MGDLSDIAVLGIALLMAFGVLQVLRALAIMVRNETMIHDLKVGVAEIQVQQFHAEMLRHGMVATPSETDDAKTDGAQPDTIEQSHEMGAGDIDAGSSPGSGRRADEEPAGDASASEATARRAA